MIRQEVRKICDQIIAEDFTISYNGKRDFYQSETIYFFLSSDFRKLIYENFETFLYPDEQVLMKNTLLLMDVIAI